MRSKKGVEKDVIFVSLKYLKEKKSGVEIYTNIKEFRDNPSAIKKCRIGSPITVVDPLKVGGNKKPLEYAATFLDSSGKFSDYDIIVLVVYVSDILF